MKTLTAVAMGLISGVVIYFMAAMIFLGPASGGPSGLFVATFLLGGAAATSWALLRNARSTNAVLRRGFLVGAAEWLGMAFAGIVMSGRAVTATLDQQAPNAAETAGAAIGGGIAAVVAGGVSMFMPVVCLMGFAIAYFMGREMHDASSLRTKKCPECAERIQPEARKCKHCGATLTQSAPSHMTT